MRSMVRRMTLAALGVAWLCSTSMAEPHATITEACEKVGTLAESVYDIKQKGLPIDMVLAGLPKEDTSQAVGRVVSAIITNLVVGIYQDKTFTRDQSRRFYIMACMEGLGSRQ